MSPVSGRPGKTSGGHRKDARGMPIIGLSMAVLPCRAEEDVEAGSAALRVDWPVYPRPAEHNTIAEGGIEDGPRLRVRKRSNHAGRGRPEDDLRAKALAEIDLGSRRVSEASIWPKTGRDRVGWGHPIRKAAKAAPGGRKTAPARIWRAFTAPAARRSSSRSPATVMWSSGCRRCSARSQALAAWAYRGSALRPAWCRSSADRPASRQATSIAPAPAGCLQTCFIPPAPRPCAGHRELSHAGPDMSGRR